MCREHTIYAFVCENHLSLGVRLSWSVCVERFSVLFHRMHAFLPHRAPLDAGSKQSDSAAFVLGAGIPMAAVIPALLTSSSLCSRSIGTVMLRQKKRKYLLSSMHDAENEESNNINTKKKPCLEQATNYHPLYKSDLLRNVLGPADVGSGDYVMEFTSLFGWEFNALLEHLQSRIEEPRDGALTSRHRPCKLSVPERLLACLSWLKGGESFRRMECHFGTAKTSMNNVRVRVCACDEGIGERAGFGIVLARCCGAKRALFSV